jgi:hypothetical protein
MLATEQTMLSTPDAMNGTNAALGFGTRSRPSVTANKPQGAARRRFKMLETIVVILLILWVLGLVTAHAMGGLIHILLVVAIVVILIRVIGGRR